MDHDISYYSDHYIPSLKTSVKGNMQLAHYDRTMTVSQLCQPLHKVVLMKAKQPIRCKLLATYQLICPGRMLVRIYTQWCPCQHPGVNQQKILSDQTRKAKFGAARQSLG